MANVSICIPTYNQSAYLERAIRSAYNQTYKPKEIIVCDDCSTDETRFVLERLTSEISILTVFYQPINLGISKNVDTCLRLASGDFVLRLDSDDILYPEYAEKVLGLMTEFPDAGYGHVAIQEVDQHDRKNTIRQLFRKAGYYSADEALRAASKGYRVAANIIMFRRSALEKVGYITTKVDFAEDYLLSVNIAAAGFGNVYLDEVLAAYRVWTDVAKVRQRRKLAEIKGIYGVFKDGLEPAYTKRGWDHRELEKRRADLAAGQADCLGWDIYTPAEKREINDVLLELSSSPKVKTLIWFYSNGLGAVVSILSKLIAAPKMLAKKAIIKFNQNTKVPIA
jgi:glycosyltransferase involved in cell wall biosynthesis